MPLVAGCYTGVRDETVATMGIDSAGLEGGGGQDDDDDDDGADDSGDHPAAECDDVDPAHVVLHRLNRTEYDNTIRDLLGVDLGLSSVFPAESHVEGFDNNAQALTISPLHVEKYLAAAKDAAAAALADPTVGPGIVFCEPVGDDVRGCAEPIVRQLLPRAYRRPVTDEEVGRIASLVEMAVAEGSDFEEGVALALQAMLVSPNFLYRPEPPPDAAQAEVFKLDAYALASRLSYFLWSSMPDDALFEAAESGALLDHEEIDEQVRRMLADPKAEAFTRNFVGQWLHVRAMAEAHPDEERFPAFDDALGAAMEEEAYRFFDEILRSGGSAADLLTAEFVLADRRLAEHYGLPTDGLVDGTFELVDVDPAQRGGLLRQGAFLTVTSHPTRTSPVQRGKWVVEQLLCTAPPPPPPGVEDLPQDPDPNATQREIFEQHRSDPACSGCHTLMDPIGFGLEGYDAVGTFRTTDNGLPLDTTGVLSGEEFDGAHELSAILAADPRYPECITRKVFTYALGRAPHEGDDCTIEAIATEVEAGDLDLVDLLVLIAQSPAATRQRNEG